jgi:hypothetical protein
MIKITILLSTVTPDDVLICRNLYILWYSVSPIVIIIRKKLRFIYSHRSNLTVLRHNYLNTYTVTQKYSEEEKFD